MPTKHQLNLLWETEFEFPETNRDYIPNNNIPIEFTGEVIGTIFFDEEKGDLKINVAKNT
jgi:hypothetical protein